MIGAEPLLYWGLSFTINHKLHLVSSPTIDGQLSAQLRTHLSFSSLPREAERDVDTMIGAGRQNRGYQGFQGGGAIIVHRAPPLHQ